MMESKSVNDGRIERKSEEEWRMKLDNLQAQLMMSMKSELTSQVTLTCGGNDKRCLDVRD